MDSVPQPSRPSGAANGVRMAPASGLALAVLFAAAFGFALHQIRFGLGFGFDEGFYLATPMRYALGDVPFRDEFFNPLRMFDVVLAPLFCAFPDLSLYALRLAWALVQLAATAALAVLFMRFAPPFLVGLACAASIWIPNLAWSPGYHVMGATFFVLGWSLWLLGCLHASRNAAIALAAASGVAFFLGVVSYVPLLAVAIVPAAVLLRELAGGGSCDRRRLATLVHLGTLAALAAGGVAALALAGLAGDWLEATATVISIGHYKIAPAKKVANFVGQVAPYVPILIAGAAIAVALAFASRTGRAGRAGGLATGAIALALLVVLHGLFFGFALPPMGWLIEDPLTRPLRVVVLLLGLQLGTAVLARPRRGEAVDADWRLVSRCVLSGSLIFAFLHAFLSSMAFKAMFAALPLVVCITTALYRALAGPSPEVARRRRAAVAVGAICLSIASVAYHTRATARPAGELAAFSHPRLAGILGTRSEVAGLEALLEHLSGRVGEGDFLLAYDSLALLYYLTGTRPAIDHAWTSRIIPTDLRRRSLRRMVEAGRVPKTAVRSLHPLSVGHTNAIHRFVRRHYERELTLPGYEIWTLRDAPAATARSPAPSD